LFNVHNILNSRKFKKMKSRFLLVLFSVFSFCCSAQSDSKSQEILKGVSAKFKTYKSLKASFTVAIENPKDKSKDVQKGTLFLKGNKYKLEVAGQEVISDGKTRWTFVKDANEVQIDNQRMDENSISPTNIFTIYEKGWISKFTGEQKDNNTTYQLIELVPAEPKNKNVFKIKLSINKADKTIASAKLLDKNGNIQTITVDKTVADGAGDEAIYVFNAAKYPGSEVVDLR
jgi:outer membrane lipoprotein-sorting protein